MIDLHHTSTALEYVPAPSLEGQLGAAMPLLRPALAFDLYPPRAGEPTEL